MEGGYGRGVRGVGQHLNRYLQVISSKIAKNKNILDQAHLHLWIPKHDFANSHTTN